MLTTAIFGGIIFELIESVTEIDQRLVVLSELLLDLLELHFLFCRLWFLYYFVPSRKLYIQICVHATLAIESKSPPLDLMKAKSS